MRTSRQPNIIAHASGGSSLLLAAFLLVKRGDENRQDRPILCAAGTRFDLDEPRQTQHANFDLRERYDHRVGQELVIAFAAPELAEDIQRTKAGLQVQVTAAQQELTRGG